jgi:hypothetical protein
MLMEGSRVARRAKVMIFPRMLFRRSDSRNRVIAFSRTGKEDLPMGQAVSSHPRAAGGPIQVSWAGRRHRRPARRWKGKAGPDNWPQAARAPGG